MVGPAIKGHTPHGGRGKQSDTDRLGDFDFTLSISIDILYCYSQYLRHGTQEGSEVDKP